MTICTVIKCEVSGHVLLFFIFKFVYKEKKMINDKNIILNVVMCHVVLYFVS